VILENNKRGTLRKNVAKRIYSGKWQRSMSND